MKKNFFNDTATTEIYTGQTSSAASDVYKRQGLGCAPIYPSIIHATPGRFGADRSQAIIGVQMASAYIGNCLMPPLFGVIANHTTIAIFPYYLLVILILMGYMHEALQKKTKAAQ